MEVLKIVQSQKTYFDTNKTKDLTYRKKQLRQLLQNIEEHEEEIYQALEKDLKKCRQEAMIYELSLVKKEIQNYLKNIDKWARPERRKTTATLFLSRSFVYKEPFGVVLILSPWNYPFLLSMQPLVNAIAAGNCVVLKLSRKSPYTAAVVETIINETFSSNYVKVLDPETDYSTIMEASYDFIFFTGSQRVGRMIMRQASENLTPVVLELGGKSPCIIDESCNLKETAKKIAWGKMINAGQTCVAPDYCLVPAKLHEKFITLLKEQFETLMPNPLENEQYGKIVNLHHYMRLKTAITNTKTVIGGAYDDRSNKIAPAIFPNTSFSDDIMKTEIFGPILPVIPYEEMEEVMINLKQLEKPLALYIFSNEKEIQNKLLKELSYGNGCVNHVLLQVANENLPFGGVGSSGMGNYHGKDGFTTFSHKKAVLHSIWSPNLQIPPYTEQKMHWISTFLK